jgi:hypothetical protein
VGSRGAVAGVALGSSLGAVLDALLVAEAIGVEELALDAACS